MAINKFLPSNLTAITAATTSAVITTDAGQLRQFLLVQITLSGTITNTTLDVSVGAVDEGSVESWLAKKTVQVRTPPGGTKIAEMAVFDIANAKNVKIALETAITGGGTASVLYAFA